MQRRSFLYLFIDHLCGVWFNTGENDHWLDLSYILEQEDDGENEII